MSSSRTTHSPSSWEPKDVLELCDDGRCVGYAPSKGRKCRMPIRYGNLERVNSLVTELRGQHPNAELLRPTLRRIAKHGLCLRYHTHQVDETVEKWMRRIRVAFPEALPARSIRTQYAGPTVRDQSAEHLSSSRQLILSSESLSQPSRSSTMSSSPSLPAQSEVETFQETVAAMQEFPQTAQRRPDQLSYAPPSADIRPRISRVSMSDISSLNLSRSSTVASSSIPREIIAGIIGATTAREDASSAAVSTASTASPVVVPTPPPSSRRCTSTHVRRLPLNEECPICNEEGLLLECDASALVWCRSSCGRTVHKSCFDDWRAQCLIDGRSLKCAVCREAWDEGCECEGCMVRHVRRREVEGECGVCLEGMLDEDGNDLYWCKHGCGKSVHQECLDTWTAECVANGRAATCVSCRASWSDADVRSADLQVVTVTKDKLKRITTMGAAGNAASEVGESPAERSRYP
ncbi:hypothetical protein EJ02DRAFT_463788 [Clathrospora elynae]|uniref:RING-type domain-containing protein n=1 Tax=Clathrospora elynae TaxID=706981 RepID=A0A6A5SXF1_9PLEO|nr:hypothetical protein EJ02DRAFT_463788 [Clathrospora elynae]